MTAQEIDRIECAIRHIQTAVDVDPWAMEIAVEAMQKQIPKIPVISVISKGSKYCPQCGKKLTENDYCLHCGQAIDWEEDE